MTIRMRFGCLLALVLSASGAGCPTAFAQDRAAVKSEIAELSAELKKIRDERHELLEQSRSRWKTIKDLEKQIAITTDPQERARLQDTLRQHQNLYESILEKNRALLQQEVSVTDRLGRLQGSTALEPPGPSAKVDDFLGMWFSREDDGATSITITRAGDRLALAGKYKDWKGTFVPASAQSPARLAFDRTPSADQLNREIPEWARRRLAAGRLTWELDARLNGPYLEVRWRPDVEWAPPENAHALPPSRAPMLLYYISCSSRRGDLGNEIDRLWAIANADWNMLFVEAVASPPAGESMTRVTADLWQGTNYAQKRQAAAALNRLNKVTRANLDAMFFPPGNPRIVSIEAMRVAVERIVKIQQEVARLTTACNL